MNINEIETPETDALLVKNAQSDTTGLEDYEILAEFAAGLERRLTVAREALETLAKLGNEPNYGNSIGNSIALQAFTQTAPKP